MKKIIFSTVLFNTSFKDLRRLTESIDLLNQEFKNKYSNKISIEFLIWDNSKKFYNYEEKLNFFKYKFYIKIFRSRKNLGYGLGHNSNLLKIKPNDETLFIALNPDIYFNGNNIYGFIKFCLENNNFACAAPLIYLPDGNIQYSAKRNPTTLSLLIGRFSILQKINFLRLYLYNNQNRARNYKNEIIEAPFLSGCFLALPSKIFHKIKGFSDNYFLHFEDADIVRRASDFGRTIHCPLGFVTHLRGRGSHKSIFQQFHLTISYYKYSKNFGFRLF